VNGDPTERRLAAIDSNLREHGEVLARIDERTKNAERTVGDKFSAVHKRIDEVKQEARGAGAKSGAATGFVAGLLSLLRELWKS